MKALFLLLLALAVIVFLPLFVGALGLAFGIGGALFGALAAIGASIFGIAVAAVAVAPGLIVALLPLAIPVLAIVGIVALCRGPRRTA